MIARQVLRLNRENNLKHNIEDPCTTELEKFSSNLPLDILILSGNDRLKEISKNLVF